MSSEFECLQCGSFTLFHNIEVIPADDRTCANCDSQFEIEHMVRFDRTDSNKLGVLLPPEGALDHKIEVLTGIVRELQDAVKKIQVIVLDDHAEELDH